MVWILQTHKMGEEREIRAATHEDDDEMKVPLLVDNVSDHGEGDTTSSVVTPMLVLSVSVAVLGSLSLGFVSGYTSPVQSAIIKELDLSTEEFSLFASMVSVGGAVGAILCGKITDCIGRRGAMGLANIFYIVGWFSIAISQGAWLLYLGRWMLGFAMSIINYAVPVYVAELTPKNLRGGFVVLHMLMLKVGASVIFLVGVITYWRTLALIGIIPCLVQIAGLFLIPESPRWMLMVGRDKEFEAALRRFRGVGANISHETADIKASAEALEQMSKVSILKLFQKKYAYVLTVGFGLSALCNLVGLPGILSYAESIFESAGLSGTVGTVTLALFQPPIVVWGVILMDRCGRRPLLMISTALLWLGCVLAGLAFVFKDHHLLEGFSCYFALIGVSIYVAAYQIGLGGVSAVILSEIYPINVKGLAGSASALVSCLCGWIVSYVFNFFMDWSSSGTFFILAGICVFTLIFVAKLVPETKGKTLEEINMSMLKATDSLSLPSTHVS